MCNQRTVGLRYCAVKVRGKEVNARCRKSVFREESAPAAIATTRQHAYMLAEASPAPTCLRTAAPATTHLLTDLQAHASPHVGCILVPSQHLHRQYTQLLA